MAGAVGGVDVSCLVWLHVHVAMGSFSVVLLVAVVGVELVKDFYTLGYGDIFIRGTLGDEGISDSIFGRGICVRLSNRY